MPALTLIKKDLQEHGAIAVVLSLGLLLAVFFSLSQNKAGAFSMSPLEVVRFSLLSIIPLIAFIAGNRLIVREYLHRTKLFIEGLPIGQLTLVTVKYVIGLLFLTLLAVLIVVIASDAARSTDDIDLRYFSVVLIRTLCFVWLIWSVVFSFSFCGFVRSALYLGFVGIIFLLIAHPAIDHVEFGPFALVNDQVFAFERTTIPWRDVLETSVLSVLFTLFGFTLALVNEGSVAESLARPLNRRDYVALTVLFFGAMTLVQTLSEKWHREPYYFSGDSVALHNDPPVSVLYLREANRDKAELLLKSLVSSLTALQAELGVASLPRVRVSLDTSRKDKEPAVDSVDGVLVRSDFRTHDSFESTELHAAVLHEVFQYLTMQRMSFEPNHWILDGFSRWWAEEQFERPLDSLHSPHHSELLARAHFAQTRGIDTLNLSDEWQLIADRAGYPSAEAIAYSVFAFLAETHGKETVYRLATEFLTKPAATSSIASIQQRLHPTSARFEKIVGQTFETFIEEWAVWFSEALNAAEIDDLLAGIPDVSASVSVGVSAAGARELSAIIESKAGASVTSENLCVIQHQIVSAFDSEINPDDMQVDDVVCDSESTDDQPTVHGVEGFFGAGDRLYVAINLNSNGFHRPLRLWSGRVNMP